MGFLQIPILTGTETVLCDKGPRELGQKKKAHTREHCKARACANYSLFQGSRFALVGLHYAIKACGRSDGRR